MFTDAETLNWIWGGGAVHDQGLGELTQHEEQQAFCNFITERERKD